MKNFFENRTWDDYLAMVVIALIIGGLAIFFVGFYWGFEPELVGTLSIGKISVHKVTAGKIPANVMIGLQNDVDYNLFSLAGSIDPSFGMMYVMVIISLVGFSMIMLGIVMIIMPQD